MESIYIVKDENGDKVGLLKTEDFLDSDDVRQRAANKFGLDAVDVGIEYVGDIGEDND